jgi:hypothetical protein
LHGLLCLIWRGKRFQQPAAAKFVVVQVSSFHLSRVSGIAVVRPSAPQESPEQFMVNEAQLSPGYSIILHFILVNKLFSYNDTNNT